MDDRPSLFDDQPALSENLTDDVVGYRPISPLAVFGAVMGLASPLALVSGFLAPLPIVGTLASLAAAMGIRRDPDTKSGLGVAVFGLCLSLVMLGAVCFRGPLVQRLHLSAAQPVVERFLAAVEEGDIVAAHQLTLPFAERRPSKAAAGLYYEANAEAQVALALFEKKPEIERLVESRPELIGHSKAAKTGPGTVSMTWRYQLPAVKDEPELGLTLLAERRDIAGKAAWRVSRIEFTRPVD